MYESSGYFYVTTPRVMADPVSLYVLYCKHSDVEELRGDITDHLCSTIHKAYNNQVIGAQKMRGAWAIGVRSEATRSSLLRVGSLSIEQNEVTLYGENPFTRGGDRGASERVLIKDLSMWESDHLISDYITSQPQIKSNGIIHKFKARNNITSGTSSFINGDRFFYAQTNINPPLPNKINIGNYTCRLSYRNQPAVPRPCIRCKNSDHKTEDIEQCEAYIANQPDVLAFNRGPFSNFDRCDVTMEGRTFITSEHCYQWMAAVEALREDVAEDIIKATSPREAKQLGTQIKSNIPNWDDMKYDVMQSVIIAKACSSDKFKDELLRSGEKLLTEGLSDMYWGSGLPYNLTTNTKPQYWPGANNLGKILMSVRADIRESEQQTPAAALKSTSGEPLPAAASIDPVYPDSSVVAPLQTAHPELLGSVTSPVTASEQAKQTGPTETAAATKSGGTILVSGKPRLATKKRRKYTKVSTKSIKSTKATPILRDFLYKKQQVKRLAVIAHLKAGSRDNTGDEQDNISISSFGSFVGVMPKVSMMDFSSDNEGADVIK